MVIMIAVTAFVGSEMRNAQFRASCIPSKVNFPIGPCFPIGISQAFTSMIFVVIEVLSAADPKRAERSR